MKKIFYIILLTGFSFTGFSQAKPSNFADAVKITRLYPNPATSYINFEFDKKSDNSYTIVIYSFIGKKVDEIKVNNQKVTIPLSEYYRGIYIFQLRDPQGNIVQSGKFQVVK